MKILYKIIRKIISRNTNSLFQIQKQRLSNQGQGLYSKETYSLFSQMYSAENENLFI